MRRDSDEMRTAVGAAHVSDVADVCPPFLVARSACLVDQLPITTSEEDVFGVMIALTRFHLLNHFIASRNQPPHLVQDCRSG